MKLRIATDESPPIPTAAARLLGSKTGIIRTLIHYLPDRSDPSVFYTTAVESDITTVGAVSEAGSLDAGGTALEHEASVMRAIGEAAERYCLYFPDPDAFVDASHDELVRSDHAVVPFETIDVFDPDRCDAVGLGTVAPDTDLRWYHGVNLLTGDEVLVPAQQVWLSDEAIGTTRWYPTTSNGTACADTLAGALIGAITERIERDAVMRLWYKQRTPEQFELAPESPIASLARDRFETAHRRIRFLDLGGPTGVPVVGCVAVDSRQRAPKFVIGGDADLSLTAAMRGALVETAQSWAYLKDLIAQGRDRSIDAEHIYNLEDNLLHYAVPDRFPAVDFLLGGEVVSRPSEGSQHSADSDSTRLGRLLGALERAGATPIAVDVTTRDIADVGLRVARVVIPELVDLSLPSLPPVGHRALAGHAITDKPHPYP